MFISLDIDSCLPPEQAPTCNEACDFSDWNGDSWTLLFRQTNIGTYLSKEEWKSHNTADASSSDFSILSTLGTKFRGADSKFHFKMRWSSPDSSYIPTDEEQIHVSTSDCNVVGSPAVSCSGVYTKQASLLNGKPTYVLDLGGDGQCKFYSDALGYSNAAVWHLESTACGRTYLNSIDGALAGVPTTNWESGFVISITVQMYQEWKQSSNPMDPDYDTVAGYESVASSFSDPSWGGLKHSSKETALLDGGAFSDGTVHYAVGATESCESCDYFQMIELELWIATPTDDPIAVTVNGITTTQARTRVGEKIWLDRNFTIAKLPEVMVGGILLQGFYQHYAIITTPGESCTSNSMVAITDDDECIAAARALKNPGIPNPGSGPSAGRELLGEPLNSTLSTIDEKLVPWGCFYNVSRLPPDHVTTTTTIRGGLVMSSDTSNSAHSVARYVPPVTQIGSAPEEEAEMTSKWYWPICKRGPSPLQTVHRGSCEDAGCHAMANEAECRTAAHVLGWPTDITNKSEHEHAPGCSTVARNGRIPTTSFNYWRSQDASDADAVAAMQGTCGQVAVYCQHPTYGPLVRQMCPVTCNCSTTATCGAYDAVCACRCPTDVVSIRVTAATEIHLAICTQQSCIKEGTIEYDSDVLTRTLMADGWKQRSYAVSFQGGSVPTSLEVLSKRVESIVTLPANITRAATFFLSLNPVGSHALKRGMKSVEVASGRPALQSSTIHGGMASRAVESSVAIMNMWFTLGISLSGACSYTSTESNPWWRVDLETPKSVAEVSVLGRSNTLLNFEIRVGSTDHWNANLECGATQLSAVDGQPLIVACGITGQYVYIVSPTGSGKARLSICAVEVRVEECTSINCGQASPPTGPSAAQGYMVTLVDSLFI